MLRSFVVHEVRPQYELGALWEFEPLDGEHAGKRYKMPVPGCWENHPDFASYRGRGIYRKRINACGNIRLVFKGVSHTAVVSLDGEKIGEHYNAYTPFAIVRTNVVDAEHLLEVMVDNRFSPDSALHVPNDYHTYGGISRPAAYELLPEAYISHVHFTPFRKNGVWHGKVEAQAVNIGKERHKLTLRASLAEENFELGSCTAEPGQTLLLSQEIPFPKAIAYELDKPVLYKLNTRLFLEGGSEPSDDLIEQVGFREVSVKGKELQFNGKKMEIKGFNRHEDHPQFGCAIPLQAMQYDLDLLADMGANAVRTSHYPNDELFLDLCDERGILVWEEAHARGLDEAAMSNPNFERQSRDCIDEMVTNHYNHPCIFIWGLLNECASDTEFGRAIYGRLLGRLRELDASRPTSFASHHYKKDICLDLADVVSFNIYPGWYHDASPEEYLKELYDWVQSSTGGAGKPFLVTETGAAAIYGFRDQSRVKWSEERQAAILEKQLNAVLTQEGVSGVFIWQFCDCRVSEEWFFGRPRGRNNKGVVDEYRRQKLACAAVKNIFKQ